jgi:polyisoprenoid-binding protein YceI
MQEPAEGDLMTAPATTVPATLTGDWVIDPTHSSIGFTARHAMVTKVRGTFEQFEGTAHLDAEDPAASTAAVTIQVASISTRNAQRDDHLRTNDFFDAPSFPEITFRSTGVEVVSDDAFRLTGDLTVKGTTKPITVDFEHTGVATDPYNQVRAGFEGKATLLRSDYGVTWNAPLETGGVLVSDKIVLEFDISAVKQ